MNPLSWVMIMVVIVGILLVVFHRALGIGFCKIGKRMDRQRPPLLRSSEEELNRCYPEEKMPGHVRLMGYGFIVGGCVVFALSFLLLGGGGGTASVVGAGEPTPPQTPDAPPTLQDQLINGTTTNLSALRCLRLAQKQLNREGIDPDDYTCLQALNGPWKNVHVWHLLFRPIAQLRYDDWGEMLQPEDPKADIIIRVDLERETARMSRQGRFKQEQG